MSIIVIVILIYHRHKPIDLIYTNITHHYILQTHQTHNTRVKKSNRITHAIIYKLCKILVKLKMLKSKNRKAVFIYELM
jgi:hypothetical protein